MINAVVLAGGLGTRLREAVPDVPKPLALIQGVAFLDLLLMQLEQSGVVDKIILAIGYRAEMIQTHIQQRKNKIPIICSIEDKPLGTGGAAKRAMNFVDSFQVFVLNGDSFLDCSLSEMSLQYRYPCTMAYTEVPNASRYGRIDLSNDGRVIGFQEKEQASAPGLINGGIYLLDNELFKCDLPEVFSLERDFFKELLPAGIFGFLVKGTFIDIGTSESYVQAQTLLKKYFL